MFNSVSRLDPQDPVDQAILSLVKQGLVTVHFDTETGQVMVSMTEKAEKMVDKMKELGYNPKPAQDLTEEDEEMIENFLGGAAHFISSGGGRRTAVAAGAGNAAPARSKTPTLMASAGNRLSPSITAGSGPCQQGGNAENRTY